MFSTVLIANRGEIACRIARTCRTLGLRVAAVYSDPDRDARHTQEADVAVRLPGAASADTYLRADLVVQAALTVGADALHPGYGFLAENADLARRCAAAGITFVGPSPEAIEVMGSKLESKRVVAAAGVPVLPAATIAGDMTPDGDALRTAGAGVGFPLLVKASAGGGGKAMRIVTDSDDLGDAVEACRREAASSFGDATVFLERYVEGARHVEIQVFGDTAGTVVHLFERECSVQRRYQKVIEEAPSPALTPTVREAMGEAAVAAARAIGYTGAGTVEFLLESDGGFWFLEMNTRLQVEHPVTELTTGLDLVRLQLLVAAGLPLPPEATSAGQRGHAIEARLYAENPEQGYLPAAGRLAIFEIPALDGVRVDAGVSSGTDVPVHYDPLLAKVIAHAPTRAEAAARLAGALAAARLHGVATNRDLLVGILRHPEFLSGGATTSFLDRHSPAALTGGPATRRTAVHAVAAALATAAGRRPRSPVMAGVPVGFRNNRSEPRRAVYDAVAGRFTVEYTPGRHGVEVAVNGEVLTDLEVHAAAPDRVDLTVDGMRRRVEVTFGSDAVFVHSPFGSDDLVVVPRFGTTAGSGRDGALAAPMPGMVVRVHVDIGDKVAPDDPLVVLEAMKMEHTIRATDAGVVTDVLVGPGDQVGSGDVVAVVEDPASLVTDASGAADTRAGAG